MFTLAHSSDWHATSLQTAGPSALLNKRFFGWLSWKRKRRRLHRPEVLERLLADVHAQAPDHVAITGDLTNIAFEPEFAEAAAMLRAFGDPSWISLVPGNHDAYVRVPMERSWDLWADYLRSDDAPAGAPAPRPEEYPTLRVRGELAVVGLCSAHPTPLFMASGSLGAGQLERLEPLLAQLGERGLFRALLVHHPVTDAAVSRRRCLTDAPALRAVLARVGAELVLHGHRHRTWLDSTPGPAGEIPVVGARSASDVGEEDDKRAQWHLYRGERVGEEWRVDLTIRGYDGATRGFGLEREVRLPASR